MQEIKDILEEKKYTKKELASLLNVHIKTIEYWIKVKGLKVLKIGGRIYILDKDVKEFLENNNK